MMENRNEYNTPREWIDDDILAQILGMDDMNGGCGCYGSSESRKNNSDNRCGCGNSDNDHSDENGRCGCSNDSSPYNRNNRRRNNRSSCGCGGRDSGYSKNFVENKSTREENFSCRKNRRSEGSSNGSCGCMKVYEEKDENCCECESCANDERMSNFPIAMAYVPHQEWRNLYEAEEALSNGTMFKELNLPFYHASCGNDCGCR